MSAPRSGVCREWACGGKRGSCKQPATGSGHSVMENGENSENLLPESQPSVALGFPQSVSADQWLTERNEDGRKARLRGSAGKS